MYEKNIQKTNGYYNVTIRFDNGERLVYWCATFDEAREVYDTFRPECGDYDGTDSAIRSDVVYPRAACC